MRNVILIVLSLVHTACGGGEGQSTAVPVTPVTANSAPTGSVMIQGVAQAGVVLSLNSTVADADGLAAFVDEMTRSCPPNVTLMPLDAHINDPAFHDAALQVFDAWAKAGAL